MSQEKITITFEELSSRRVDNRLREQDAMERNRNYSQLQEESLPTASKAKPSIWNNAIFCMAIFGMIGGILGWGASTAVNGPLLPVIGSFLHYQPTAQKDSIDLLNSFQNIDRDESLGKYTSQQAASMREQLRDIGRDNPYFRLADDMTIDSVHRKSRFDHQVTADRFAAFQINVLSYGFYGMLIAMCLAIAEPVTQRKIRAAFINGGTGAVIGFLGGVVAALLVDRVTGYVTGAVKGQAQWVQQLAGQMLIWGTLGIFLGMASGMVLLNVKKFAVGAVGGLLGGLIGGAIFDPVQSFLHHRQVGRLLAMIAIGVVAGLATGFLENAIKSGWLKVTSGIIAGKQFILYRNPTYIGSAPDCQIYLFKDPQVGKRHAAIHVLPGSIEIENLPLGTATLINGRPVERVRLANGDEIQIGATSFRFQEKRPVAGK